MLAVIYNSVWNDILYCIFVHCKCISLTICMCDNLCLMFWDQLILYMHVDLF